MVSDLPAGKPAARKAAAKIRLAVHSAKLESAAAAELFRFICTLPGASPVSGYLPIRSEVSPLPAMHELFRRNRRICVPVVGGEGVPLRFREWSPDAELIQAKFGVMIPERGAWLEPGILIVPLLAFDLGGYRLGYGGGFYDRTLAQFRDLRPTVAIGFAFEAQRCRQVPSDSHDQKLDAVVTERGTTAFGEDFQSGIGKAQ